MTFHCFLKITIRYNTLSIRSEIQSVTLHSLLRSNDCLFTRNWTGIFIQPFVVYHPSTRSTYYDILFPLSNEEWLRMHLLHYDAPSEIRYFPKNERIARTRFYWDLYAKKAWSPSYWYLIVWFCSTIATVYHDTRKYCCYYDCGSQYPDVIQILFPMLRIHRCSSAPLL